jgi:hypothetical protein
MRCNVLSLQSLAGVFGRKPWLGRSLLEKDRQGALVLILVKIPQLQNDNLIKYGGLYDPDITGHRKILLKGQCHEIFCLWFFS